MSAGSKSSARPFFDESPRFELFAGQRDIHREREASIVPPLRPVSLSSVTARFAPVVGSIGGPNVSAKIVLVI